MSDTSGTRQWRGTLAGVGGLALLGLAAAPSCATLPAAESCEAACAVARRCGLLPSALGGTVGEPADHKEQSCVARCLASEGEDPQVASLLALLGGTHEHDGAEVAAADLPLDLLCDPAGADTCKRIIEQLERDPGTSELEVTTTLTVRMTNLVSHATSDSLSSWCCFEYARDLDGIGDGVDELAAVHDMFQPTYTCLAELQQAATDVHESLVTPGQEDQAPQRCTDMVTRWRNPPPGEEPWADADPCTYARDSSRLRGLPLPATEAACDPAALDPQTFATLSFELERVLTDWSLAAGDALIDDAGAVRPVEEIRPMLQAAIREELRGPGRLLERACADLFASNDAAGCDALDLDALAEPLPCANGPDCSTADCLEASPACDVSLCDAERSPPGRECGLLGVTEVRLGYRDTKGLEVLGEPITGCEALTSVASTFEGVKVGHLVPVAVVSGTLPSFLFPDDTLTSSDGPFSWVVEGDGRWVTAGAAELEVPSFLVERIEPLLENPLEALRWVPQRFPTGKACDTEPQQCEGWFNENCDNGLDDDGDGVSDHVSAWCDDMFRELALRCVVEPPGSGPAPGCVAAP